MTKYKRSRELISEALLNLYPNECEVNRLPKQLVEKNKKIRFECVISPENLDICDSTGTLLFYKDGQLYLLIKMNKYEVAPVLDIRLRK